jgi:hypothetical protein
VGDYLYEVCFPEPLAVHRGYLLQVAFYGFFRKTESLTDIPGIFSALLRRYHKHFKLIILKAPAKF